MMKLFVVGWFLFSGAAMASAERNLPQCVLETKIEELDYGMVHKVQVPQGVCLFLGGSLKYYSREACSDLASQANSTCYQVTKTKIFSGGRYVGKTRDCWGCVIQKSR